MPGVPYVPIDLRRLTVGTIAGGVLLVAASVIFAALAFEHIGGYTPCPLCLQQRYAYYAAIPAVAAALALLRVPRTGAAAGILLAVGLAFVVNTVLGAYQAGAEWGFWAPPDTCSTPADLPTIDLGNLNLDRMPASCGVANWRLLGLSFAGWNVVASALLAAGAGWASFKAWTRSG